MTDWKGLANEDWQPSYSELSGQEIRDLRDSLIAEQGGLCCYCNKDISDGDFHLEHFKPQHPYVALELEYQNILACCIKSPQKGVEIHCGHVKGDWFCEQNTLSPLQDHEDKFQYLGNGVVCSDDVAAVMMVEKLNLNEKTLKASREETIAGMLDEAFLTTASTEELELLLSKLSVRDSRGYFNAFLPALQQQIKQYLPL